MARPRIIKTKDDLERQLDAFIAYCQQHDDLNPTDFQLAQFLGVSAVTLDRYYAGGGVYEGFDEALKKIVRYREDRLVRRMEADPRQATAAIVQLKQPRSGGYVDKPAQTEAPKELVIKIDGLGGGAFD